MVRKVGFEPTRLAAPPPQDGASASSATSAGASEVERPMALTHLILVVSAPSGKMLRMELLYGFAGGGGFWPCGACGGGADCGGVVPGA